MASRRIAHYQIIQKLGAGGMGEVFLAQDTRLERKVAIKTLPAKSIDDVNARRRLFREARAAATLDHPNICGIHEVNEDGDCVFIVMQYVEGETLAQKLLEASLSTDEVLDIGIQVAEALSEAHSRGVIHRDIKPQNVIVTPRGQVKVLDFGLARMTQKDRPSDPDAKTETQLTEEGYIVGTVAYMSPEQLKGAPVDARSDVFSLGVLLYECAAGAPPFTGSSKIEISSKVLQIEPRKPSELNPLIPPLLERIILKAMAKEMTDRYQTVDELLRDLKSVRASMSGATELFPSVTRSASSEISRSPVAVALRSPRVQIGVVAAALLIILAFAGYRLWRGTPNTLNASAKPYFEKGIDAIHAATYFQASTALKKSVDLDPQYAPARTRLAEAYLEISNTEQAKDELRVANQLAGKRSLTTIDQLRLDAINAIADRDFQGSISSYQKVLDQAPAAEKANASVDLGRAYERADQTDKAIENYLNATRLDAQSAGAFLHLGIAYGRKPKPEDAEKAFARSAEIYGSLTNSEGLVEVAFQRGLLLYNAAKLTEAKTEFEKVLAALKTQKNDYQLTRTELQLSLIYRDQGNLQGAKELASDAVRIAQLSDIKNIAANGLINLGLPLMNAGNFDEARNLFQQALDLARRDKSTVTEMRAHLSFGRLYYQMSDNDAALAELQTALNFYRPAGYRRETSIALSVMGRVYQDKGEDETALRLFQEQSEVAEQAGDESGAADSHMNLAQLAGTNHEKYPEALAHLDEKLKIDEKHQSDRGLASDQMNRGKFLWQLARYAEARAALDAAFEIANRKEAQIKTVLAWVYLIRGRIALSQNQYAEAKKEAQLALDLSDKFPDVALQARSTIGLAQAMSGATAEGRKLCEEGVTIAQSLKARALIAGAQLALAEAMLLSKDNSAAIQTASEAQKIFGQSGQKDSEWRALLIAARASAAAGDKSAARDYAGRAETALNSLPQIWGAESYESYLRRPDIQLYRKQLAQISA